MSENIGLLKSAGSRFDDSRVYKEPSFLVLCQESLIHKD